MKLWKLKKKTVVKNKFKKIKRLWNGNEGWVELRKK